MILQAECAGPSATARVNYDPAVIDATMTTPPDVHLDYLLGDSAIDCHRDHASIQMTVDTYGHLIPGANRGAVDRLDDAWTQPDATQAQPQPHQTSDTLAEMQGLLGNLGSLIGIEPPLRKTD